MGRQITTEIWFLFRQCQLYQAAPSQPVKLNNHPPSPEEELMCDTQNGRLPADI